MIIGDNFFEGLQVVFGTMTVWSEVHSLLLLINMSLWCINYGSVPFGGYMTLLLFFVLDDNTSCYKSHGTT